MDKNNKNNKIEILLDWLSTPLGNIIIGIFLILIFGLSMKAISVFLLPLI